MCYPCAKIFLPSHLYALLPITAVDNHIMPPHPQEFCFNLSSKLVGYCKITSNTWCSLPHFPWPYFFKTPTYSIISPDANFINPVCRMHDLAQWLLQNKPLKSLSKAEARLWPRQALLPFIFLPRSLRLIVVILPFSLYI